MNQAVVKERVRFNKPNLSHFLQYGMLQEGDLLKVMLDSNRTAQQKQQGQQLNTP
jgi:hypothetical protein